MCNAWNHSPGCNCGWGDGGYSGGGGTAVFSAPAKPSPGTTTSWQHGDDFCRRSTCPICGEEVFFVRHNGGSVWFDDLGGDWPKHACFDDAPQCSTLRSKFQAEQSKSQLLQFGVIIKSVVVDYGKTARLTVKFTDGTLDTTEWATARDVTKVIGALVVIQIDADGKKFLQYL